MEYYIFIIIILILYYCLKNVNTENFVNNLNYSTTNVNTTPKKYIYP